MKDKLLKKFEELHGDVVGAKLYFSPGRVNLIGEHTDYNGGHVFPCALTLGTWAVARKRKDRNVSFYSMNLDRLGVITIPLDNIENKKHYSWANYPLGMVWTFQGKGYAFDTGFDLVLWGNIPNGAGLSSSASIEVLTGLILKDLYDIEDLSMVTIALHSQYSENEFNGMNCGIMDQFTVAMGKKDNAVFLDTSTLEFEYAPIVLSDAKIMITNSKVKHSLVESEYNTRRNECTEALHLLQTVVPIKSLGDLTIEQFEEFKHVIIDPILLKRAKHAVYENQRTIKAVQALKDGDLVQFGKLMNESHVSLRDDYEVSCEEVDVLVDLAWSISGVLGSRITGGGFGGCTVSIVKNESIEEFKSVLENGYKEKTGKTCEIYEAEIGDGARILTE